MNLLFRRFSAGVFLLGSVVVARAAVPGEDATRQVESLERQLVEAIAKSDMATYDRIVADDYVAFEASGKESSKAEILKSYRSGARRYTGLEIFDVEARVFGDTAVVSAKTRGSRREGDQNVPNRVHYIRVYAHQDGRWRAVTQISAPLFADDPARPSKPAVTGNWGGDHIGLQATDRDARLEFDCAHGSIDEPITPDERGRFELRGTYVREGPGPIRQGESQGSSARYTGTVEGDAMTLSIQLSGSDVSLGTFTLERGRLPRVRKCG